MIAGGPRHGWRTEVPRLAAALILVVAAGLLAFVVSDNLAQIGTVTRASATLPKAAAPTPTPVPLSDIARADLSRVVTVEAQRATDETLGTAWLIDNNCDYVTNAHVVYGQEALRITDRGDHTHTAVVAGENDSLDIALIHCTDGFAAGAPLPVDRTDVSTVPEDVVTLASSQATGQADITLESLDATDQSVPLAQGDEHTDPQAPSEYEDMLELSGARIYQGNSGGPVLDQAGQVVGVVTLSSPGSSLAYAIPITKVLGLLESYEMH